MKKLKNQIYETEAEANRQREALKAQLTHEHEQVLHKTIKNKDDEISSLTKELEESFDNVENLKKMRNEDFLLAENSKEQVLIMAQNEQKSLSERLHEALANLDTCQKELDKHRLDANAKLEKDRCSISELQIGQVSHQLLFNVAARWPSKFAVLVCLSMLFVILSIFEVLNQNFQNLAI